VHDAVKAITAWVQRRENASPSAGTFEVTGG
jgi:hypothetical protein